MAIRQAAVPGFPFPAQVDENTTSQTPVAGAVMVDQTTPANGILGVASTTGIGTLVVQAPPTYMISSSRAGLQAVVVADYTSNNTYMVSNVGTEQPPFVQAVSPSLTLTGVAGTSAVGTPGIQQDASFTLTGVAGISGIGTPTVLTEVDTTVTGVAITSAIGTPTVRLDAAITLTGVSASSAIGDPTVEIDDAALIGQAAIASVGTVVAEIDHAVTGVASTSAAGDPSVDIFFPVFVTGVYATPLVGLLLGTAVPIIGVETTSAIGSFTVDVIDGAILDGVESTVTLGTLDLQEDNNPSIVGVQTTLGTNLLRSVVEPEFDGVEATGEVGDPIPTNMQLPGTAILVQLGTIVVEAQNAVLVGLQALAQAGRPLAISTGNHISVAVSGVTATPAVGTLITRVGIAITGVEADFAIGDVAVGTTVSSGLMLTDVQIETVLDLRDDFSVTLRWSDTDGYSWSDSAIRSIGQTGNYLCNPQWRRLGMSRRGRVYELSWSCPQATSLQGATIMFQDASS